MCLFLYFFVNETTIQISGMFNTFPKKKGQNIGLYFHTSSIIMKNNINIQHYLCSTITGHLYIHIESFTTNQIVFLLFLFSIKFLCLPNKLSITNQTNLFDNRFPVRYFKIVCKKKWTTFGGHITKLWYVSFFFL